MIWKVARQPGWAAFRTLSRLNLLLRRKQYRYVFILGHVRSGSSLLAHILASHPDIVGAGETHLSYLRPDDLPNLILKTCELLHRPFLPETYIVDQINHSYVSDETLLSHRIYGSIILIRQPEATLKSMMSLSIWPEQQALELYTRRLETLTRYGLLLKRRALLLEYDDLVGESEKILAALTNFLNLPTALTPNYTIHRMTRRVAGYGDPSKNIRVGQIVRTPKHEIAINPNTLRVAKSAFAECRLKLQATVRDSLKVESTSTATRFKLGPPE